MNTHMTCMRSPPLRNVRETNVLFFIACVTVHTLLPLLTAARELYVVEGGKHNDSWLIGGQPYLEKFKAFIFAVTGGVVDSATPSSTKPRSSSKYRNSAL